MIKMINNINNLLSSNLLSNTSQMNFTAPVKMKKGKKKCYKVERK